MTFLKSITKEGWTIYIYSLPDERYMIEYSNDGFDSKQRKEYETKDESLEMLKERFDEDDLSTIAKG